MSGCIYLIENLINGKKYVGQHNKPDPKKRWSSHKTCKRDGPLQHAFKKHGFENFRFSVLCVCPLDKLTLMEGYYAEVFGTYVWNYSEGWNSPGGYNAILCSDSYNMSQAKLGTKASDDTKKKMSIAASGKPKTLDSISKRLATMKELVENGYTSPLKGRKRNPDCIKQMLITRKINMSKDGYIHPAIGRKRSDEYYIKLKEANRIKRENGYINPKTIAADAKKLITS